MLQIGYWRSNRDLSELPNPKELISKDWWKIRNKKAIVEYLKNGIECNHYFGYSSCRICSKRMGAYERHDGKYCWPDQLEHYIEEHDVILPEGFVEYALSNKITSQIKRSQINTNIRPWIAWGILATTKLQKGETK